MPGQWINGTYWPDRPDMPSKPPKRRVGCVLIIAVGVAVAMGCTVIVIAKALGLTI